MFGYVKPVVGEMLVREHEFYKATYCGLCRAMGKRTGCMSKMTLSYDFVFLVLLRKVAEKRTGEVKMRRCIAHPFMRRPMLEIDETLEYYDESNVLAYNGNPVYFTSDFSVKKGTAFSCGVTIGEIKKNYILPHHQFFMALGNEFKRKINLSADSDKLKKYLHGEEISVDCENGWAVITTKGCSVGGVKVVSGRAKNHYPKGLRKVT